MNLFWFARSQNKKTGDVPQAIVGADRQETWDSCFGCDLREGECYAWHNGTTVNFMLPALARGLKKSTVRYTVQDAMRRRHRDARYARMTAIGDPARVDREKLLYSIAYVLSEGLGILGYSHFWRDAENQELKPFLMASCRDPKEADAALDMGWRATAIVPAGQYKREGARFWTPKGRLGVICPAQTKKGVICNTCGLCANTHRAAKNVPVIGFEDHSPAARYDSRPAIAKTLPLFQEAS